MIIPLLPSGPPPPLLLCPINPICPGRWVNTRNGRKGRISGYFHDGSSVQVKLRVGLDFLYPEVYTIAELATYNPQWRQTAAAPMEALKVA